MSVQYAVLVPLKASSRAKSRLHLAERHRLALAMAGDTLAAVAQTAEVRLAVLVAEEPDEAVQLAAEHGVDVLLTRAFELNAAVSEGAAFVARYWAGPVAVLPADLPYLSPADLAEGLRLAAGEAAVVGDAAGTGTTLLAAPTGFALAAPQNAPAGPHSAPAAPQNALDGPQGSALAPLDGTALRPRFGLNSLLRHREAGFTELAVSPASTLRRDVDTVADLQDPVFAGQLGPRTAAFLERLPDPIPAGHGVTVGGCAGT